MISVKNYENNSNQLISNIFMRQLDKDINRLGIKGFHIISNNKKNN